MGVLNYFIHRVRRLFGKRKELILAEEVLLPAILAFREHTTYLWPALVSTARKGGRSAEFSCGIRFRNYNRILPHLERLVQTGCLEFSAESAAGKQVSGETTMRVTFFRLHPAFLRWVVNVAFDPTLDETKYPDPFLEQPTGK